MKTSELIKKLQILLEKHGDNELEFKIKDYFMNGRDLGNDCSFDLRVGDTTGFPTDWNAVSSHSGFTFFSLRLKDQDGKKPKIMYRS